MNILYTTKINKSQKTELFELWNAEYPVNLAHGSLQDFDKYLDGVSNHKHFLLCNEAGAIQGWHFQFTRDDETWFGMIISSKLQGQGWGSKLLNKGKKTVNKLAGWVVDHADYLKANGEPYISPLGFYLKNDFEIVPDAKPAGDKLSAVKVIWSKQL